MGPVRQQDWSHQLLGRHLLAQGNKVAGGCMGPGPPTAPHLGQQDEQVSSRQESYPGGWMMSGVSARLTGGRGGRTGQCLGQSPLQTLSLA